MLNVMEKPKLDTMELFQPLNYFMVRSPVLPLSFYDELFSQDLEMKTINSKLKDLAEDPFFQEAIFISSHSLYNSIINWNKVTDAKKKEQLLHSFSKYLIRMSTRPTPFGLLSGVTYGLIQDEPSNIILNSYKQYTKRARPDMAWLLAIVHRLENDLNVLEQLVVKSNHIILSAGNRLNLPYNSNCGQHNKDNPLNLESISIRNTEATKIILELTKQGIKVKDLIHKLSGKFPEIDKDRITLVIQQLVKKEYLITELRPSLMISNPFEYVLSKINQMEGIEALKQNLHEIHLQINTYNNIEIGKGIDSVKELSRQMRDLSPSDNPIQVDVKLSSQPITLNSQVVREVCNAAEILWKISPNSIGMPHLNEYREEFIEKHGTYREIPLLELLDEDHGLGAPATYNFPKSHRKPSFPDNTSQKKQEQYLLQKLLKTYRDKNYTISLNHDDIANLSINDDNIEALPDSLELYGTLIAQDKSEIDQGNFKFAIGFNPGSDGAGKTFGRFIDILNDNKFMMEYKKTFINETSSKEDIIFAELVYLPPSGRSANVSISENFRNYEIAIGTNSSKEDKFTIPVSDLLVGATMEEFYIKSKTLGKRIIFTLNHMLNIQTSPNLYRFLAEISSEGIRQWAPFMWHSLESSPFLPRIEYGKSILSLAKWNINNTILNAKETNYENWKSVFYKWMKEWKMPRYVYHTLADNRILLDLYNPLHLQILYKEISRLEDGQYVTLVEKETSDLEGWIRDDLNNPYNVEFVFPLKKNEKYSKKKLHRPKRMEPIKMNDKLIRKFPGDEWLYIKLYGNASREEELISYQLKDFFDNISKTGAIQKFFFMRYADPKQHIRLRFYGKPQNLNMDVLPALNKWLYTLQEDGLIQNADISTYEREVERYGGPELIDLAENIFFYDSLAVSQLLYLTRIKGTELSLNEIATVSVIHYLDSFGLSFKDQLSWFNNLVSYKDYLKEFRKGRKTFMRIGNNNDDWSDLRNYFEDGHEIITILNQRQNAISTFIERMKHIDQKASLYNDIEDILGSIIHLHLNRLIGIDRERETKIMTLVRHTLHNLRYLKEDMK